MPIRAVLLPLLALAAASPPEPALAPLRMTAEAFGGQATIEVRELPREAAEPAIRAALDEVRAVERLTDPLAQDSSGRHGVAWLNDHAGRGPQPVDPVLLPLLARAGDFCVWSEGATGPLSGALAALWGLHAAVEALPTAEAIQQAAASAACDRLKLDAKAGTAEVPEGSRVDLWSFADGFAADRAVEALRGKGVANALVVVGRVTRALGGGRDGKGWEVVLPLFSGFKTPLDPVWLRDRALGIARASDRPLTIAGDVYAPYIDQRRGRPPDGVLATLAASDLGVDAAGLASTLFVTGSREGELRLGVLRPSPSILWLLGSGDAMPLITEYRWSALRRP